MITDSENIAIVFDTNAYRIFSKGQSIEEVHISIAKLRELESKKNIKAFCSLFTGYELLSHLADKHTEQSYVECLNGIIALGNHCWDNALKGIPSIPQTSLLVTNSFFDGAKNEETNQLNQNLIGLFQDIKQRELIAIKEHYPIFQAIAKDIFDKELNFADRITFLLNGVEKMNKELNPGRNKKGLRKVTFNTLKSPQFKHMIARALIEIYSKTVGVILPENNLNKAAQILNEKFPVIAGFYTWVCHEVYYRNIDLYSTESRKRRWNWLWDSEISASVSESTIGGRDVYLVTGDEDIFKVFKGVGYENKVMKLTEYQSFLNY